MKDYIASFQDGEHEASGFGASWVLAEDDWGSLRVPSIRERVKHGEPWWVKHFNPRNPWHLVFYIWTRIKRGVAMVEC